MQVEALAQSAFETERLLTLTTGKLPLVLVAPHGGREAIPEIGVRTGNGVPQFKTGRDHNTAELAAAIAAKLGEISGAKPFLVIARFDRKYIDANRPFTEAYEAREAQPYYAAFHSAVDKACEQIRNVWGRGLLLDLHGQGAEANVIFRGTRHGKSVADLVQRFGSQALSGSRSILGQLALRGYKILPDPSVNDASGAIAAAIPCKPMAVTATAASMPFSWSLERGFGRAITSIAPTPMSPLQSECSPENTCQSV